MKDDDGMDRSLIEAARDGLGPTDEDRIRVRRAVRGAIASGAAIGAAGAATTASAAAKGAVGAWTIVKAIAIGTGVLTVAAGATWGVVRVLDDAPVVELAAAESAEPREHRLEPTKARALGAEPALAAEPALVEEADLEPELALRDPDVGAHETERTREHPNVEHPRGGEDERDPARHAASDVTRAAETEREGIRSREQEREAEQAPSPPPALEAPHAGPALGSALAAPPVSAALTSETALLREVHRALRTHDPARALSLLEQHAARFPEGVLAEERSATRVLALCDAGRTEQARAEASRFLAAHPRSMHARRVRASRCATP